MGSPGHNGASTACPSPPRQRLAWGPLGTATCQIDREREREVQSPQEAGIQVVHYREDSTNAKAEGESNSINNPLSCVYNNRPSKKVTVARNKRITSPSIVGNRCAWLRVKTSSGASAYFLIWGGLLYYRTDGRDQACDLLLVLCFKIDVMMHLAHSHLLRGHLGTKNILAKLSSTGQVWKLRCITSDSIALSANTPPQRSHLQPHSFLYWLSGWPAPKVSFGAHVHPSDCGLCHLVPWLPLRKATFCDIAWKLVLLFSCVGKKTPCLLTMLCPSFLA